MRLGDCVAIQDAPEKARNFEVSSGVSLISLPRGTYQFSVREAQPVRMNENEGIFLPAIHVGLGPGASTQEVEFVSGANTENGWLYEAEDTLVARITGMAATLVITSIRSPHGQPLQIDVEQLSEERERRSVATDVIPSPFDARATTERPVVRTRIITHIRNRGDMTFEDMPWAGRLGAGYSIEAFSVVPFEPIGADGVEYKALTATGFETPWITNGGTCGTQGMAIPLVGFAVRFRPSVAASQFQLEYSGYFRSGRLIGPIRDGAPCRSAAPGDPLEGISVRIVQTSPVDAGPTRSREAEPRKLQPEKQKTKPVPPRQKPPKRVNKLRGRSGIERPTGRGTRK